MGYVMQGKSRKFILLALQREHIERRLLASASGLCRRMNAGLHIMLSGSPETTLLQKLMDGLQKDGIDCCLTQRAALNSKEIVHYANTHACISTVMIDSLEHWIRPEDEKSGNPWRKLACPLVVAMPN